MKKWGISRMVNRLFKLFTMCLCRQEFVLSADLGVDDLGTDEEMRDLESGLLASQIVWLFVVCVLLFCISWESTLYDGNSKEILGSIRPWDCGCQDAEGLWFSLSNSWGSSVSMDHHHRSLCNVNLTCWQPMNCWFSIFRWIHWSLCFKGNLGPVCFLSIDVVLGNERFCRNLFGLLQLRNAQDDQWS
jgi:hypothetical protein